MTQSTHKTGSVQSIGSPYNKPVCVNTRDTRDTIVAISTAHGHAALGVVRLSGPGAVGVCDTLFKPNKAPGTEGLQPRHVYFGHIVVDGEILDEVLVTVMKGPNSYTGEDMVEFSCHGNPVILSRIVEACVGTGACPAEPGEFTKRAFLNGKLDLTQAEAVCQLIHARTDRAVRTQAKILGGGLRKKAEEIHAMLVHIVATVEAALDYEEEQGFVAGEKQELIKELTMVLDRAGELLNTARAGMILTEGLTVAIVGKVNVGKSSLLNRLASQERAIVTDIPGTTRDLVEADVRIGDFPVKLVDTAGFIYGGGAIDVVAIEKSKQTIYTSDLVLLVLDPTQGIDKIDIALAQKMESQNTLVVLNKRDIPWQNSFRDDLDRLIPRAWPRIELSALTGEGLNELEHYITEFIGGETQEEDDIICNVRQKDAIALVVEATGCGLKALKENLPEDFVASDLREALEGIDSFLGINPDEEVLDAIFSRFCIGK